MSEHKTVGAVVVVKHKISGMSREKQIVAFEAYEASSYMGNHGTLFTIEGKCHGSIPSRRLPPEIDALKGEPRYAACDAFRKANMEEAYAAILAAYPEASEGKRDGMGGIELW